MSEKADVPVKLKPFIELGFVPARTTGNEARGECPFCGKTDKFYVNTDTGQWSCKAGHCQREGNVYSFMSEWHSQHMSSHQGHEVDWERLRADRGLPVETLKDAGMVWDGAQWYLPIHNFKGSIINFKRYSVGGKLMSLSGLDVHLYNAHRLTDSKMKKMPVFLMEGEWDGMAMEAMLSEASELGVVVAQPGAGTFKDQWAEPFSGRDVTMGHDNDPDGERGKKRVHSKIGGLVQTLRHIRWPDQLPNHFDARDFYKMNGTIQILNEVIEPYVPDEEAHKTKNAAIAALPLLSSGTRPKIETVFRTYRKWMQLTEDLETAVRLVFAVVYANQIDGDPLWLHIAAPPSCGKTEVIIPAAGSVQTVLQSTLSPHQLISGMQVNGGKDPSLIPQLIGKIFLLKDFTEVLRMPRMAKDEVYAVLRGAYDGRVEKCYGNGTVREYNGYFNMVCGVTPSIFAEQGATLGERFLIYHMFKGTGADSEDVILAAIANVGNETKMKAELSVAAAGFLDYQFSPDEMPDIPLESLSKLVALSQVVAMLRAVVEKDVMRDKLYYRPQHETGARIAKQLKKLLLGLAMLNTPPEVTEEDYRIVRRVGLDTCIGFNLEMVASLLENASDVFTLSDRINIPVSTLRDHLEDLTLLGALKKEVIPNEPGQRGAPKIRYSPSDIIQKHWLKAELEEVYRTTPKSSGLRIRRDRGPSENGRAVP